MWSNGDVYIGKWKDNLCHGEGKFYFSYSSSSRGSWDSDYPDGVHICYDKEGIKYEKRYNKGTLLEQRRL